MNPASFPICAFNTFRPLAAEGKALLFIRFSRFLRKEELASTSPPPTTITSGFKRLTTLAKPVARYSASVSITDRATLSLTFRAAKMRAGDRFSLYRFRILWLLEFFSNSRADASRAGTEAYASRQPLFPQRQGLPSKAIAVCPNSPAAELEP